MAITATTVWEMRPTNGTADAGGGFDPATPSAGTDFSQQDAVEHAYTDLVIDAVTSTDITSAARPFTSVDIGNIICTVSGTGFTTGRFCIRSIQAGNKARLDRSAGTLGSTGGNSNLGGAVNGVNTGTVTLAASVVGGNYVWIKKETWNEAVTTSFAAAAGNPVIWEGYKTTRGDVMMSFVGADRPVNDRGGAAGDAFLVSGNHNIFRGIIAKSAGDAGFSITASGSGIRFDFCRMTANTGEGIEANSNTVPCLFNCEIDLNGVGVSNPAAIYGTGNYVHDNGGNGMTITNVVNCALYNNIVESNSGHGIQMGASHGIIANNTIYGNTGASSDGLIFTTVGPSYCLVNNIFASNGRDGLRATDGDSIKNDYNCFFGNGGAARTNVPAGDHDVTTDPQFVDAANGDFSIGTNLRAAGFPGLFPG